MLHLHQVGGGSSEIILDEPVHPAVCVRARERAARLLDAQGQAEAAALLRSAPFQLWNAHNGFWDEFRVLHADVPASRYIELSDLETDPETRAQFRQIAGALDRADSPVRFIAASLNEAQEPEVVPPPNPATTSDAIERSLAEVERALASGQPAAGVDRIHTALHAYLRELAVATGLTPASEADITALFALLRREHPALQATGPRSEEITRVLRAMATVVDVLNPLRNNASLAHPPAESLLADAEAMLVINAVRTLLHYIEKRLALPHSA